MIRSWGETPAGLLANGGLVVEAAGQQRADEVMSAERRFARIDYERRMDAADPAWRQRREYQRDLAANPGGLWINMLEPEEDDQPVRYGAWNAVDDSPPPELAPLHARAAATQTRVGTLAPGQGKDTTWLAMEREAAESRARAARQIREGEAALARLPGSSRIAF